MGNRIVFANEAIEKTAGSTGGFFLYIINHR